LTRLWYGRCSFVIPTRPSTCATASHHTQHTLIQSLGNIKDKCHSLRCECNAARAQTQLPPKSNSAPHGRLGFESVPTLAVVPGHTNSWMPLRTDEGYSHRLRRAVMWLALVAGRRRFSLASTTAITLDHVELLQCVRDYRRKAVFTFVRVKVTLVHRRRVVPLTRAPCDCRRIVPFTFLYPLRVIA
jgi:hypothetical protein